MLTQKEMKVLRCLRKDARRSMTTIAKETKLPLASILLIMRRLENSVVTKYTTLLNHSALGHNVKVHFMTKGMDEEFLKNPQINTIYKISGKYNYFIEGIFKDLSQMEKFKERLGNHRQFFVMEETKVEEFQP